MIFVVLFVVGLVTVMMFSSEGRGCLGGLIGIIVGIAGLILLGAAVLAAIGFLVFQGG